jgi:hypothetical protein
VDATSRKYRRRHPLIGADGVVRNVSDHPVCASKVASLLFWIAQPPLRWRQRFHPIKMILAPLPGASFSQTLQPRVSHKTLHPGLISNQPSGLSTPKACKYISPGYASFAYPGKTFRPENRTPKRVRGVSPLLDLHL